MQGVGTGHDARFDIPPEEVPWGSIALALFLTMFGAACFGLAWMHLTQQIFGKEQAEMAFSLVGLLTFIPGVWMGGWVGVARLQLVCICVHRCAQIAQPSECCGVPAQVHTTRGSPSVSGGASQATTGRSMVQPPSQCARTSHPSHSVGLLLRCCRSDIPH